MVGNLEKELTLKKINYPLILVFFENTFFLERLEIGL